MEPTELRQAAIDRLKENTADSADEQRQSSAELIHELHVHQVELEMQNEELRRAQLELENARDRFAYLFDFAPVGYVTLDDNDRIVEANLTVAELLGVNRDTLVGQVLSRFVAAEDSPRLVHHLRDVGTTDEKVNCELTMQHVAGIPKYVRLHSISVANEHGGNSLFIAIVDLSNNVSIIQAKKDSDERLRVIYHALPIPIAYVDEIETYQFNNAAHESWFKLSRELIMGRHVRDVLGNANYEIIKSHIKQVLAGHSRSCRIALSLGDSGPREVEAHFAPYRNAKHEVVGYYELMIDVSANRLIAEEDAKRATLEARLQKLSSRQRAVFDLLMAGESNKAITHRLDVGMRTVERERHDILALLGVESINEMLVSFAGLAASDDQPGETP